MKKILLGIALLTSSFAVAQIKHVLFVGNSYTYVNNLPQLISQLADANGDSLIYDSSTPGGYTFQLHSTDATTLAKIAQYPWDMVVLQEQSQIPSWDPAQVATDCYPYARALDSLIQLNDSCTETFFYMTWGRQNGDASNCPFYTPVCTYDGMQQRLRESYLEMGVNNHASVSPVGVAWKHLRDLYPSINLYQADESHPSIYGSYLAACVFYSSLYHKSCVGNTFIAPGISSSDANLLQSVASSTVLDSLSLWQGSGDLPLPSFLTSTGGLTLNVVNESLHADAYTWDFGDGGSSVLTEPTHTFPSSGSYTVSLTASNACTSYTVSQNIEVLAAGVNSLQAKVPVSMWFDEEQQLLKITGVEGEGFLRLYDVSGRMILERQLSSNGDISLHSLSKGLYFARWTGANDSFSEKLYVR